MLDTIDYAELVHVVGRMVSSQRAYLPEPWQRDKDDLIQDVLLAVWLGLPGFDGRASFNTWLYRIVRNRCIDYARTMGIRAVTLQCDLADSEAVQFTSQTDPAILPDERALRREIWKQFCRQLTPHRRRLVLAALRGRRIHSEEWRRSLARARQFGKMLQRR